MIKISAYAVGRKALIILKYKVRKQGLDLRPSEFAQLVTKRAQLIGCSRDEILAFFNKYLVPEILVGCELKGQQEDRSLPNEREAKIAYRLLKMGFFWDLRGLREEVYRIVEKTPLEFEEVAAIVSNIAEKHLRDELSEGAIGLDIDGGFELK